MAAAMDIEECQDRTLRFLAEAATQYAMLAPATSRSLGRRLRGGWSNPGWSRNNNHQPPTNQQPTSNNQPTTTNQQQQQQPELHKKSERNDYLKI